MLRAPKDWDMRRLRKIAIQTSVPQTQLRDTTPAERALRGSMKCACGRLAETLIHADMLGGIASITIGVCTRHEPPDEAAAYSMISALLAGVARAGGKVAAVQAGRRRKERRG